MFRVLTNQMIVPNIHLLTVEAPDVARAVQPGQFVIVRAEEDGERIPLSISDWDSVQGTLTILYLNVGVTTNRLTEVKEGETLPTVVGPLGLPTQIENFGTVVCVGGCFGVGSIYPVARALKAGGNRVITVIEGRSSYLFYWEEKLKQVSDEFHTITRDGSRGRCGHITHLPEIIAASKSSVSRVIANGCTFLCKRTSDLTRPLGIKTIVSLCPIMIDGTGMCGVCRVTVNKERKFACVDGPDFDGHQVDWAELVLRRQQYLREEVVPFHSGRCGEHRHG